MWLLFHDRSTDNSAFSLLSFKKAILTGIAQFGQLRNALSLCRGLLPRQGRDSGLFILVSSKTGHKSSVPHQLLNTYVSAHKLLENVLRVGAWGWRKEDHSERDNGVSKKSWAWGSPLGGTVWLASWGKWCLQGTLTDEQGFPRVLFLFILL